MQREHKNIFTRLTNKLYGGIPMSWPVVILSAVGVALLTAVFLVAPVFQNTSFERMGVYLEAWIFFAMIIMANCKKPLESACKTFVFFLISQPLSYLLQVPFSWQGWGLFRYYGYWFVLTVLTFPAAFIGWYITKKNWLSLLILAPVLVYLGITAYQSGLHCIHHFPYLLITLLFCLLQIVLYGIAFLPGVKKLIGFAVAVLAAVALALTSRTLEVNAANFLPGDPILTESAAIVMQEDPNLVVTIERTGQDSMVRVQAKRYGDADFTIADGDREYRYTVSVYEDDAGHAQIRIEER